MTVDLIQAVGFEFPDTPVSWNKRDLILYAIGIGAKADDLPFVYELHPKFAAFPTYPVVLALKGSATDVILYGETGGVKVPGLPKFDVRKLVHGSQSTRILKPLPLVSGDGWKLKKRISGVHENKSGIIVDYELTLVDSSGTAYNQFFASSFNIGAKSNPSSPSKFSRTVSTAPPPIPLARYKDRPATHTVRETTSPESAVIYRLSGDYNPLHIDPSIGKSVGFGGAIIHGLATYGYAARAVLEKVGGGEANNLKYFSVRFTSPVKPGGISVLGSRSGISLIGAILTDEIETKIWELGSTVPDGSAEVAFITTNLSSGKVALGSGTAYVLKASSKSKL